MGFGNNMRHGLGGSKIYQMWYSMMSRCYQDTHRSYKDYGGRGVVVDEEWHDVRVFAKDVLKLGYKEGLSIDRIDVNGSYEPSNIRFITMTEQRLNMRNNVRLNYNGKEQTVVEWARELEISPSILYQRIARGWSVEDTLSKEKHFKTFAENKKFSYFKEVVISGKKKTVRQWMEYFGIQEKTVKTRVYLYDWTLEKALTTPYKLSNTKGVPKLGVKPNGKKISLNMDIEINGRIKTLREWLVIYNITMSSINYRVRKLKRSVQEALVMSKKIEGKKNAI